MSNENNLEFALKKNREDQLKSFRSMFHIPKLPNGEEAVYLCGNSLGLQPKSAAKFIEKEMQQWQNLAVEGWFEEPDPWVNRHQHIKKLISPIIGALPAEAAIMNTLTINLHLLMVSFYQPTKTKYKILIEGGAFPSDQYAVAAQAQLHGFNPDDAIVEFLPSGDDYCLKTSEIIDQIHTHQADAALILLGGVNYFTGQFYDIEKIAKAAQKANIVLGLDLAHAVGNVPLKLHNWQVDFACWCSYKYLNSGPGGIGGIFVHEKHHPKNLKKLSGWWGYKTDERFKMKKDFVAEAGADGWMVSTHQIIPMAMHLAALQIFEEAGGVEVLRKKSLDLSGFLYFLLTDINAHFKQNVLQIITPKDSAERGCQLSVIFHKNAKMIFEQLSKAGFIGDWREPNVIRLSPVPLYNTFEEVYKTALKIREIIENSHHYAD